jgi:hypothetical protein
MPDSFQNLVEQRAIYLSGKKKNQVLFVDKSRFLVDLTK